MVTEAQERRGWDVFDLSTTIRMKERVADVLRYLVWVRKNPTKAQDITSVIVEMVEENHGGRSRAQQIQEDGEEPEPIQDWSRGATLTKHELRLVRNALDACRWMHHDDSHYETLFNPARGTYPAADRFLDAFSLLILLLPNLRDIEMFFSASWACEGGTAGLKTSYPQSLKRVALTSHDTSHEHPANAPLKNLRQLDFAGLPFEFIAPLMALPSVKWVAMEEMETCYYSPWPAGLPKTCARDVYIYNSQETIKDFAQDLAEHTRGPCHISTEYGFEGSDDSAPWLVCVVAGQNQEGFLRFLPVTGNREADKDLVERARAWGATTSTVLPDIL